MPRHGTVWQRHKQDTIRSPHCWEIYSRQVWKMCLNMIRRCTRKAAHTMCFLCGAFVAFVLFFSLNTEHREKFLVLAVPKLRIGCLCEHLKKKMFIFCATCDFIFIAMATILLVFHQCRWPFFCLWIYPLVDQTNTIFIFLEIMMLLRLNVWRWWKWGIRHFVFLHNNKWTHVVWASEWVERWSQWFFVHPIAARLRASFYTNIWISRRWVRKC